MIEAVVEIDLRMLSAGLLNGCGQRPLFCPPERRSRWRDRRLNPQACSGQGKARLERTRSNAQDEDVDVSASEWPRRSGLSHLGRRLSREEIWLRSDQRVLELAEDATVPLLERVRFL